MLRADPIRGVQRYEGIDSKKLMSMTMVFKISGHRFKMKRRKF